MGGGQIRVGHLALPHQPQRRIDKLAFKALVVQIGDPPVHVFEGILNALEKSKEPSPEPASFWP